LSRLLRPASPDTVRRRVHPPSSLPPLQSATTRCPPSVTSSRLATTLGAVSASLGVRLGPHRDVSQPEPPAAGSDPSSCYGPSSAFLPPSTVCSPVGLAGLFHPAAAYRVPAPQGFVPRAEPCRVTPADALVPFRPPPLRLPAPRRQPATSGPCSPRRVRTRRKTV